MNKVILMGRLTRDPDVRYTQGPEQMCIARFTIAVDRRQRKQDGSRETDFISCVAFGKLGELAEKYYRQGTKLSVCGRLQTGSYTNRDGQKVYTTDVVLEEAEFAESKSKENGGTPQNNGQENGNQGGQIGEGFMNIPDGIDDEGLPFN